MKKYLKLITSMSIAIAPLLSSCLGRDPDVKIDTSKSQLYVGVYDGGYGIAWAEKWGEEFEKLHTDTSYEDGKTGVQVLVTPSQKYALGGAATSLEDQLDEIIFTEQTNYFDFMKNNAVMNITEWVTTPLTEYGEDRSIKDKMNESDVEYYQQSSSKPEFYAVPWYTSLPCISYDISLFEDDLLYFAAEGKGDKNGFIKSLEDERSLGPDGKTGIIGGVDYSLDDGLPSTFDEFLKLCDAIVDYGNQPLIWSGSQQGYVNNLFSAVVAQVEGFDSASLNYTFNGTCNTLIENVSNPTKYLSPTQISAENGYLLRKQAGNYYGVKFLENIISNSEYYSDECFSVSFSHTAAQAKFLKSRKSSSGRIAMLIDGTWWYNEATNTFNSMASGGSQYSQAGSKIGIMTIPQPTKEMAKDNTLMNTWTTSVVVRKNVDSAKVNLIRDFFRFAHTDANLSSYMLNANGIRPFKFSMTGMSKSDLPVYVQQQYDFCQNYKIVNPYSSAPIMKNYQSTIVGDYTSIIGTRSYDKISQALYNGVSAEDYFNGMQKYMDATSWRTKFLTGAYE